MPCNYGWIENRTMTFEETQFTSKKLIVEALEKLGFTAAAINDLGYEIRVSLGSYRGSLQFTQAATGYKVQVTENDLAALNRAHGGKFMVALRKQYGEALVRTYVKKLKGKTTRTTTAEGGERVVIAF